MAPYRGLLLVCAVASVATALHLQLAPPQPRCTILMKGRSQGGGPAIAKKTKNRRKNDVRTEIVRVKRKEYQEARIKAKAPELGLQRQHDRHLALLDAGAERWPVFVRVCPSTEQSASKDRGEEDGSSWLEVGAVSFEAEQEAGGAAILHKRLILEHACRLYPKLLPHREALEMGLVSPAALAALEEDEEPVPELVSLATAAPEKAAGFGGLPDPHSGHYFGESEQVGNDGKKMLQDSNGLAATKASTAMSFSKSLGLRSG